MTTTRDTLVASIVVHGEPRSKARPRFTTRNGRVTAYTPRDTRKAEDAYADAYRSSAPANDLNPNTAYTVRARFFYKHHQRRDVDNMLKAVLDGLNGVAWGDDTQVLRVSAEKIFLTEGEARSEIDIFESGPMPWTTVPCIGCGKAVRTYPSNPEPKFCGRRCQESATKAARTATCLNCGDEFDAHSPNVAKRAKYCSIKCRSTHLSVPVTCAECGTEYLKARSTVKSNNYCSPECSRAREARRAAARRSVHSPGQCRICGGGTSRKKYTRCNACRISGAET